MNTPTAAQQVGLRAFNGLITNPRTQDYLSSVLGAKKEAFINNVTALVANSPMLQKCEPQGIMYAAIKATALDLPFDANLGFAYVIPYGDVAQFQIGWRGFVQLALRSGQLSTINVGDVKAGEIVGEDFVSGEMQFQRLAEEQRVQTPTIGYFAYFKLVNGFSKMLYMSVAQLQEHGAKYSKTFRHANGQWQTNFDAMAKKTVVKLLLSRWCPLSLQMQQSILADQAVISETGLSYVDSPKAENAEEQSEEMAQAIIESQE